MYVSYIKAVTPAWNAMSHPFSTLIYSRIESHNLQAIVLLILKYSTASRIDCSWRFVTVQVNKPADKPAVPFEGTFYIT